MILVTPSDIIKPIIGLIVVTALVGGYLETKLVELENPEHRRQNVFKDCMILSETPEDAVTHRSCSRIAFSLYPAEEAVSSL